MVAKAVRASIAIVPRPAPLVSCTALQMAEKLTWIFIMWRWCGCFFVANFNPLELSRSRVSWKSFYTFYSAACAFTLCTFRMYQIFTGVQNTTEVQGAISSSLYTFMRCVIGAKSLVVFSVMSVKSATVLEFFHNCRVFDKSVVVPHTNRSKRLYSWPRFAHGGLFAFIWVYTFQHFILLLVTQAKYLAGYDILRILYLMVANVIYLFCDYGNAATIRCIGEVLVEYVRIQADVLKRNPALEITLCDIEEIGKKLSSIQGLKEHINGALSLCIVFFCLKAFSVISISGYMLFRLGFTHEASPVILVYSLYVVFGLINIALVSNALEEQTENCKVLLADMATGGTSTAMISKLRFLHNNVNPQDMCLNGGGLFAINLRILLYVAEATITYGLILIQTGDFLLPAMSQNDSLSVLGDVLATRKQ